jgi:hypothetical protein
MSLVYDTVSKKNPLNGTYNQPKRCRDRSCV